MAKYQKYAEYKDTGIKLLGEVPKHWQVASVRRYLLDHRQGYYTTESYVDDGLKLLRITDLRDLGEIDILNCPMVKQNESTDLFKLKKGDVVFARTGGAGSFGVITKNYENLIYASYLIRFRFMDVKFESNYLRYLCLSDSFQLSVKQNIHGGVNQNIHAEDIKDTVICTPPLLEQNQITKFLDQETAKINLLIAKQEKLIELLKEKRQAVISHAVTKGLNLNVTMKDSGVEWLGQVPEHWKITKLSYVANGFNGDRGSNYPSGEDFIDDGIPFISTSDLIGGKVLTNDASRITEDRYNLLGGLKIKYGDIIYCLRGSVGKNGICEFNEGTIASALMGIRCNSIDPYYLLLLLNSSIESQQRANYTTGSVSANLSAENVMSYKFAFPPEKEQLQIVENLKMVFEYFDQLITKAELAIKLMQERRTALISAAVTGKIDVRHWQSPNKNNNQNNMELSA
ncbi:type I restriction enzyme, S subunit [Acinetobacter pittii]|uniref:restriction endonuclease subunit S n=1 Tax=Acinetobacter TaxID=469 RepID=UPI0005C97EAA|nr:MULTISPECIES: restriction endonuclease subunit S [Acinetobacter]KQE18437.1 hypothetical protein APD38_07210 [Acinetobacter pittii]KQE23160.1 hypothetical protein APD39_11770 [Acinetobacter pittii]KQE48654.1 hypothetical protein APD46_04660 [Acinetobacter pittii]KRJ47826.1 hypothetical protein APC88_14460 [Acinetobacter pittii]MBJ8487296.1 restriction endonuclease subunit S [Acinetobacter pittii]